MPLLLPLPLPANKEVTGELNPEATKRFKFYRASDEAAEHCTLFTAEQNCSTSAAFVVDVPTDDLRYDDLRSTRSGANMSGAILGARQPKQERSCSSLSSSYSRGGTMNSTMPEDENLIAVLTECIKTTHEATAVISGEKTIKRGVWQIPGATKIPCVVALPQDGPHFCENRDALLNELKVLKRLNVSPAPGGLGVIRLLAAVTDSDTPRVVTELVKPMGYDLSLVINKYASFMDSQHRDVAFIPATEVCGLLQQIVTATQFLHENKIIHRDLKPENVLVTDKVHIFDGVRRVSQTKVIDFGCAALLDEDGLCRTPLFRTGSNIAPEVLMHLPHSKPVDSYGIGAIVDRIGNLELEPWAMSLLEEEPDTRWSLERLSEEINARLHATPKPICKTPKHDQNKHVISHLNALGMIIKVEGLVAVTLLGEELRPASMIQLRFRSRGLHIVLLKHEGELHPCPSGSSFVQNGDRLVALVDPSVSDSARPRDLRLLLGVHDSVDLGTLTNADLKTFRTSCKKRSLQDSNVLPCFIEFDEVTMPLALFQEVETKHGLPAVCIMGPKSIANYAYLCEPEKQALRQEFAKEPRGSIVVIYMNLACHLPNINVSGIARAGENGDEFIWPDGKGGICKADRLLLARFDSRNTGSSESTHQLDEVQEALAACRDFETDIICAPAQEARSISRKPTSQGYLGQCARFLCCCVDRTRRVEFEAV